MAFGIGDIKLIDSFQCMASSLQALAENLITKSADNYEMFEKADELNLVCQTRIYPYEFMDGIDKFEHTKLRPKDKCYSSLRLSGISDENYEHALNVYDKFKCSKFLDYHMLNLNCDDL